MAQVRDFLLLLLIVLGSSLIDQALANSSTQAYIVESCRATRYPALCIQCLAGYPTKTPLETPQQLAQAALTVSFYKAVKTRAYMLKVIKDLRGKMNRRDSRAIHDCVDQVTNGIAQLSRSVKELHRIETSVEVAGGLFYFHISNVETWVSTAITDATNCADYFPGRRMSKVKATIKVKVLNTAMVASNALALFNRYAAKYRAVGAVHMP